ncbi:restriction endonuclease [Erwinia amylovora]|uniref:Mrr restriction system protein (EcoKMrr) n=6 Tax=Erwinia amylovora TaxID=552 RepID=A0A831A0V7_ERWAM|nr:restriction endonuclease [Erwinia amylovora]CBX79205.1 Mrr restriction system protein (EcoKMrr) [Erwinia amylovora ATCC BAA-2158]CDK13997.1 Mrr restriction system protein (EcoKMrr) [Erwinia amylovora LA635]CDK20733.1 Mrr restriction system protein (EcoKMrr) [Erwinia amylovora LA637]ATZ12765.1 restriction endonuclease [Erwinia amylovora]EKV55244.1 Mrr restriction system protein (EcoKMrr) [Erwinia amylovora ACW56400]
MTIIEAIIKVLKEYGNPLSHNDIYDRIIANDYYSFGAKDPISVVRGEIRKHCYDIDFPSASPRKIFIEVKSNHLSKPLYDLWRGQSTKIESPKLEKTTKDQLPEEIIHSKYIEHIKNVKNQLLDAINSSDPAFFERLVVTLLLKMGYGWHESEAGKVIGGAGDEGIDGIINEDKLGLEKIYIQAKRYNSKKVPPSEIREFIGSMNQKGAHKGVFFSSSCFTEQAMNSAQKAQGMTITLIDGQQLCEYLVQNGMGVAKVSTYDLYEIDRNFFDI